MFRNKRVVFVCGMRRSGNHALISWLVNAFEEQKTELIGSKRISTIESENIIFINEINTLGNRAYLHVLFSCYGQIRRAKTIIISAEDVFPDYSSTWRVPSSAEKIVVQRSTLNLIASRLKHAISMARVGRGRGDMRIDEEFFEKLLSLAELNSPTWAVWRYDTWMSGDLEYRRQFLADMDLYYDLDPNVTKQGGGSSFSGNSRLPSKEEVENRWKNVDWPERIVGLLGNARYAPLLSDEEIGHLKMVNSSLQRVEGV